MMHGTTSVMDHCINVAYTAYYMSYKLNMEVNDAELIRGALLHDYFLYDWHIKDEARKLHGFCHPIVALENAQKDFELTKIEKDII